MQPPLHSLWKQFLLGPGQRARQPAYLGAHRELFTYLFWAAAAVSIRRDVPAELMSFCIKVRGVTTAVDGRSVTRLAIAFFAAPESCRRSILVAAGAEPSRERSLSTRGARTAEAANAGRRRCKGSPDERLLPSMRAIARQYT